MSQPRRAPSLLAALQGTLETIYDVRAPAQVDDFLITDPAVAQRIDCHGRPNVEKLLIDHGADSVDLSLFIAGGSLSRLAGNNPLACLSDANFDDFCIVLEGVSHFTYVACNAAIDKQVTLLELELQAEVDKFIVAGILLARQHRQPPLRALSHRLFARVRFAEALSRHELERYHHASHSAKRFCRALQRRWRRPRRVMADLRRFYRMPKLDKLAAC